MWTVERGYSSDFQENIDKYPRPGVASGNEQGINLIMKADVDDYFCSSTESFGFKVLIHNPNDLPMIKNLGMAIPSNFESRFAISPTLAIGAPSIRSLAIDVRKCIFQSENFLSYFSTYSETNCITECETKILLKNCGCIKHFQPMRHPNMSICGTADTSCINTVDHKIFMKQNPLFSCSHCLPGCFALNYDISFSTAMIFDRLPFLRERKLKSKDVAILHIYYSQTMFRAQKKEELVGFAEFLANLGGLLGLFLGFSGLSVIEIFYFISIRPYCQFLRLSNARRELMKKLTRKIEEIRHGQHSPNIMAVQPKLSFDQTYYQRHLD
ncbi:pickpocket protein 28-like [Sitodiplosis mosellana]|uniref:pickpocket protein 28-like n=1 Tax=Sitodiplosis mosellana TaxID=263140 RepID=UPI002443D420|nr:pickpocket protein 28-like [Sitodiplosis mosellana]